MSEQTFAKRKRRWGDNDLHFGPLTFAFRESWRPFAIVLSSGSIEHESPGCNIRFQALGCTMICELPQIVKPYRKWTKFTYPERSLDGYWDEHPREYGFSLNDNHLHVKLGAQTHDSITTQDWGCFLPWREWRVVAERVFNPDGSLVGELRGKRDWQARTALIDKAERSKFAIIDHDGERIGVETYAEEWDRRLGMGWFWWLGYLVPMQTRRSLDIHFKSEVGPEKGSWKGGMTGHSIEMLPGESQESAMRRYCDNEQRSKHGRYRITFADVSNVAPAGTA